MNLDPIGRERAPLGVEWVGSWWVRYVQAGVGRRPRGRQLNDGEPYHRVYLADRGDRSPIYMGEVDETCEHCYFTNVEDWNASPHRAFHTEARHLVARPPGRAKTWRVYYALAYDKRGL